MSKRTVLAALVVFVGGLTSLSAEGLGVGVPLLLVGGCWLSGRRLPLARLKRAASIRP